MYKLTFLRIFVLVSFLFFTSALSLFAQSDSILNQEKDIQDILKIGQKKNKGSERKFDLSIVPAVGYSLQTGFAGLISANLAFYNGKNALEKISSINTNFTYSQYNQIIVPFVANIWTNKNKLNFISDFRFISYPSSIFGLGNNYMNVDSNSNIGYAINYKGLKLHQSVMLHLIKDLYAGGGIYFDHFWKIRTSDSLHPSISQVINQQLGKEEKSVGLALKLLYDSRLNQINPHNGLYAAILLRPNYTWLGSDQNWTGFQADIRKYFSFPKHSKNILALWAYSWQTFSKQPAPYLLRPSIGWDDQYNTGRGYIQGRFRGNNMYYFESEYRFGITKNKLLGGVIFSNVSGFSGDLSKQFKDPKIGYGLGLRIKVNKKSGANLCIDYGFGQNGSRGFFVNLGEIF